MDKEFAYSFKEYQLTGNSWTDCNPITKLIICLCVGTSAIVIHNWRYCSVLIAVLVILSFVFKIGKSFSKSMIGIGSLLLIFTVIIRQIGYREINHTVMFTIGSWVWYLESFEAALDIVTYMLGFAGAFLIFFLTTPMRDIMYALERKGVGHETSYIMLSSMQSITDMKKSAEIIIESQKARGIETEGNAIVRAKAFFPTLGPIVLNSMSGTEEKSIAMDARAFSYKCNHTFLRELRPTRKIEIVLDIIFVVYLLACVAYKILISTGML